MQAIQLRVLLFAGAREACEKKELRVEVTEPISGQCLADLLSPVP